MNARRQIIAALSAHSVGLIATLAAIDHAEQLVNAHRREVLREGAKAADQMPTGDCSDASDFDEAYDWGTRAVAERLREMAAEVGRSPDALPLVVFRAEHDSIVMGLYTEAVAARAHCEAEERRSWPTGTTLAFDWIEDEEDGVAELVVTAGQNEESVTGHVVTVLEVASVYDEEADE